MKLNFVLWSLSFGCTASIVRDSRQLQSLGTAGEQSLPRQTVERVEGIESIQEFLEFAPAWDGKQTNKLNMNNDIRKEGPFKRSTYCEVDY